jgi:transcriptional regulator with XRE-family HTH domain
MKVTNTTISLIKKRFRDPKKPIINQSQLAEFMGLGKAWVSKLMNGKLQTLSSKQLDDLETFLGIRLQLMADKEKKISPIALEISAKMQESDAISRIIEALLDIPLPSVDSGPRWIETKDMTKIGQEIIRLCFADEDKPGKVAREVLKLLA